MTSTSDSGPGDDAKLLRSTRKLVLALRENADQVEPARVVRVLRRLRKADRLPRANRVAQLGLMRFPNDAGILNEVARLRRIEGQPDQAARLLTQAIAADPSRSNRRRRDLIDALIAAGAKPQRFNDAYRAASLADPGNEQAVASWVAYLLRTDPSAVLSSLNDLQRQTPEPVVGALLRLLTGPSSEAARQEHHGVIQRFLQGDTARLCQKLWRAYAALQPLSPEDCHELLSVPFSHIRLYFAATSPSIVSLADAAQDDYGLSREALGWFASDFLAPDPPVPDDRELVTSRVERMAHANDRVLSFQARALRERRLLLRDPHSGIETVPFDNVIAFGRSIYSFGDTELTFFISGGLGNKAICLLLPRLNVMIDLGADLWHHITPSRIANMQAQVLLRVAESADLYAAALDQEPDALAAQHVVAMIHSAENFAHHLWNCYPGVERLIDLGLQGNINEIRTTGTEFFGPVQELFPELSDIPTIAEPRRPVRDPYPFSREHLLIAPGGYLIRKSLVQRLVQRMRELPSNETSVEPPEPDQLPFPVVWIGLRVGSRAWVGQERVVPATINAIHERHPDALFLLDGYSYPVGRDEVSRKWLDSIDRLHAIADQILQAVEHPQQVLDLVGNTLRESVLWASVTDVYLAPSGTSQHKVGWISSGPGLVYGPAGLLNRPPESRAGAYESEGRPVPTTIVGPTESAGARRSETDNRNNLDNVRLDRGEVLQLMLDLIDSSATRSQGGPTYTAFPSTIR